MTNLVNNECHRSRSYVQWETNVLLLSFLRLTAREPIHLSLCGFGGNDIVRFGSLLSKQTFIATCNQGLQFWNHIILPSQEPNPEDPLNKEAAEVLQSNRRLFEVRKHNVCLCSRISQADSYLIAGTSVESDEGQLYRFTIFRVLLEVIYKIEIVSLRLFDNFDVGRTYLHQLQIGAFLFIDFLHSQNSH